MKEPYCFKCVNVKLPDNFLINVHFREIYIYQGFRNYSIVNKNKYFQYILLHNKKSFIIKDNRYFIPTFNFNLLRNTPVIINRDNKVISIPSDVLNDNKDLNLTDSIKPLYETSCNFTPPKN